MIFILRLIQQPLCVKVPKEVCVNAQVNPKKVGSNKKERKIE
jgi:hypothetical protein